MTRYTLPLLLLAAACGDNLMMAPYTPDGPQEPVVDAGPPPDAEPPDALLPPGEDEPCAYLEMPEMNYPIRFKSGQGLEASPDLRQTGLLDLLNAELSNRDVIEKRRGAVQLGDNRSATPGDVIPDADRRAIWARGDEVLLETHDSLYHEQHVIPTFTWGLVASWIRTRLREAYAGTFGVDVLSADYAVLGDATLVAYELDGGFGRLELYGPTQAQEARYTFNNSGRPRISSEGDLRRLSYVDTSRDLQSGLYNPATATVAFSPVGLTLAVGRLFWDVTGQQMDNGDHVSAWIGTPSADASTAVFSWDGATPGTATRVLDIPNPDSPVTDDCSVTIFPVLTASGRYRAVVAQVYLANATSRHRLYIEVLDIDPATATINVTDTENVDLGADPDDFARAVALSWEDFATLWIAVEQDTTDSRKVSYYRFALAGVAALVTVHEQTSLSTQGAILAGTPTITLPATELLSPGFGEQLLGGDVTTRSGWVVFAPRTSEIVARSFVGFTGNLTTRAARPAKGSLIAEGNDITWAGPASVPSDPSATLRAVALCRLDRTARANKPAQIDGSVISPHGGYPRAYDGTSAFEHDWHTLPRITAIATGAGTTTDGDHRIAVIWEHDDANGLRYPSAPAIDPGVIDSGGSGLDVTIEPMTHTERSGVRAVVYMTPVESATYHRAAEALVTGAAQTINVSILDVTLAQRETLRQAPVPNGQGILPSLPARVTDFVSLLIDRLASRDPRVGSLMTFTTPSAEAVGFAAHWPGSVVQEPLGRDVTSAIEMDGRIFMGSELGIAELQGDGPSATNVGSFGIPLVRRVPIGIEDHASTERTPLGYAFGTAQGPRLLQGLTVVHVDEQVERHYSIDGGHVVAIAWDALREEIVFLDDSTETLRLNPHNGRWGADSNRAGRDLTVREDGVVYFIRDDGKVLRNDPDTFSDGVSDYPLTVGTPHIREVARDGLAHGGFIFNGVEVFGEYMGRHDLKVTVTLDFRDTPVIFEGTIPAATIDANAVAGRDYRYVLYTEARHCYACKVVVETSGEPNATARIAGIDVRYNGDGSANPAQVDEEQRFPLDVSFLA